MSRYTYDNRVKLCSHCKAVTLTRNSVWYPKDEKGWPMLTTPLCRDCFLAIPEEVKNRRSPYLPHWLNPYYEDVNREGLHFTV